MRKLIFLLFLVGCTKNEPKLTGCVTGINKSSGQRESMGCWSHKDFISGTHAISYWNSYTSQKWIECSSCN